MARSEYEKMFGNVRPTFEDSNDKKKFTFWKRASGSKQFRIVKTHDMPYVVALNARETKFKYDDGKKETIYSTVIDYDYLFDAEQVGLRNYLFEKGLLKEEDQEKYKKFGNPWKKILPFVADEDRNCRGGLKTQYVFQVIDTNPGSNKELVVLTVTYKVAEAIKARLLAAEKKGIDLIDPDGGYDLLFTCIPSRSGKGFEIDPGTIDFDRGMPSPLQLNGQELHNIYEVVARHYWIGYDDMVKNIQERCAETMKDNGLYFTPEGELKVSDTVPF